MSGAFDDQVRWGRSLIRYRVGFSARKTLAIHVHPDLSVEVVAPLGSGIEAIRERVLKRAAWIQRSRREFSLYSPALADLTYVNGEAHRYLGRQYRLRGERGEAVSVKALRGRLVVTTTEEPLPQVIRLILDRWYRERAKEVFSQCLERCQTVAAREGIGLPPLTIRRLDKRWGSCSKRGRVTLNLELIRAPRECIDYVIMHELCHLKEPHHGPRFWRLLERLMPDYEALRERLNRMANE